MPLEQDSNPLFNSAAIPLPTPRNSAADRHLKITTKPLIYNSVIAYRQRFSEAETGFFPAVREQVR